LVTQLFNNAGLVDTVSEILYSQTVLFNPSGALQVDIIGSANVVLEGRASNEAPWETLLEVTKPGVEHVPIMMDQMRLRISSWSLFSQVNAWLLASN